KRHLLFSLPSVFRSCLSDRFFKPEQPDKKGFSAHFSKQRIFLYTVYYRTSRIRKTIPKKDKMSRPRPGGSVDFLSRRHTFFTLLPLRGGTRFPVPAAFFQYCPFFEKMQDTLCILSRTVL
ncbi:MAG: hypothetical protein ACI4QB_05060, partial [Eubacteriales bacterium]